MRLSDTMVGAGFAATGILIVASTLGYPTLEGGHPGPALFPRIVGGLMALAGVLLAVSGARARDASEAVAWRRLHRSRGFVDALCVLGGVVGYIAVADRLGFLLSAALLLFLLMWRLRVPPLRALAIAAVLSALVHLLFAKLLRVPLPPGLLWW